MNKEILMAVDAVSNRKRASIRKLFFDAPRSCVGRPATPQEARRGIGRGASRLIRKTGGLRHLPPLESVRRRLQRAWKYRSANCASNDARATIDKDVEPGGFVEEPHGVGAVRAEFWAQTAKAGPSCQKVREAERAQVGRRPTKTAPGTLVSGIVKARRSQTVCMWILGANWPEGFIAPAKK